MKQMKQERTVNQIEQEMQRLQQKAINNDCLGWFLRVTMGKKPLYSQALPDNG